MLAFLTETKKMILKGIAIATAVGCITLVGLKLSKKMPPENVSNDTITNQCKNLQKSEGNKNNKNSSKRGAHLSPETPITKVKSIDFNAGRTTDLNISKVPLKIADGKDNYIEDSLSDTSSSDYSNDSLTLVPGDRRNIMEDSKPSDTEFDSSQESSSGNSSYTKSSQNEETSQCSGRIQKGSIQKFEWVDLFPGEFELKNYPEIIKETFIKRDGVTYVKAQDGKEIKAGTFHEYSVGGLKSRLRRKGKVGGGKISAIGIEGKADVKYVDVARLQADPQYANNTVFVLASNFNALETLGSEDNIDDKALCSYAIDDTQGPIASISAPATAFYRQYGIFRNKANEDNPLEWKQRNNGFKASQGLKPKQLNLLEDLGINTKNGYVIDEPGQVYNKMFGEFKGKTQGHHVKLPQGITLDQLPSNKQEAYDKFKIAYFSDCQVVYNSNAKDKNELDKFYDENQCVDQVCVAALALGYNGSAMKKTNARDCECAKLTIKAQYEAIFRAAALHGKKNVVIPIVGGGVFNNDAQWTIDALNELKDIIKDYGLNVIVNTFKSNEMGGGSPRKSKQAKKNLIKLIEETGGTFNEYRKGSEKPVNLVKAHRRQKSNFTHKYYSQSYDRK